MGANPDTAPSGAGGVVTPLYNPAARFSSSDLGVIDQQLSLANGMTAGYGVNDGNVTNPLPHPGQYGSWPYQPLRVGFMRNTISLQSNTAGFIGNGLYTLYFMYNPNQISINWSVSPNQGSPVFLYGAGNSGTSAYSTATQAQTGAGQTGGAVPALAQSQTVAFSLYFDRTYDMMFGNGDTALNVSAAENDRGVLKDVAALYNLMGTFISDAATPVSTPIEVVFGQNADGQLFGFTGYMTQLAITYGIFRHDMIPSQCECDITLMATYVQNAVNPNQLGTPTGSQGIVGTTTIGATTLAPGVTVNPGAPSNNPNLPAAGVTGPPSGGTTSNPSGLPGSSNSPQT